MLIILLGPSGSGKTTIEQILQQRGIHRLRSHTTRGRKNGERSDAYYFVKKEDFKKADMVESVLYKNNFFGLSRSVVKMAEHKDCVVTLDWNGAQQLKRLFPFALTVYLDCPMYQLEKRLPIEVDSQKHAKRMEQIENDAKCAYECDYIVSNYDQQAEEAATKIMEIYQRKDKLSAE